MSFGRWSGAVLLIAAIGGCTPAPLRRGESPSDLPPFRPPAVPLVVQTPYLNVWLFGDRLTDDSPKLWNGQVKGMAGLIRVDGKAYRFLGMADSPIPAMKQEQVRVWPTRTEFHFAVEDVRLKLEFLSPLDPRDLEALSLPLVYLRVEVSTRTGREIQLHLDITGEWAVGSSDRRIAWEGGFRIRPSQPRVFHETSGFPDWGEVYWAAVEPATSRCGPDTEVRQAFIEGRVPRRDDRFPRPANDNWPVFAHSWDLGAVRESVIRRAVLAHVRPEAVLFLGSPCLSYWTKVQSDGTEMIARAIASCEERRARALEIDREVLSRARAAGGAPLAALAALAFRQTFAANELVLHRGKPIYFSKSLDLSGANAIQSVETLNSASPALLAFNPKLVAMEVAPLLEAIGRDDWSEPFAMRDLGIYPNATGPANGDDHPVETTAMLLLLAAAARREDPKSSDGFPPVAEKLLRFLDGAAGTDSLPAALAIQSVRDRGPEASRRIHPKRTQGSPSHFYLAGRLLGLDEISSSDVEREIAAARARSGKYGPPREGQRVIASVDDLMTLAALASKTSGAEFVEDVLRAMNETPTRVPAGDRYETDSAKIVGGQAGSTLGAIFAPLLLRERGVQR